MKFSCKIASASSAGSAACNEDLAESKGNDIWIFDGATSISKRSTLFEGEWLSDAAWFVKFVSNQLKISLGDDLRNRLFEVMEFARAQALEMWGGWEGGDVPSASFAHAGIKGNSAVLHNLGDCKIIYSADNALPSVFGSCNVSKLDAQLLKLHLMNKLQQPDLSKEEQWSILHPHIRRNREKMNKTDGYWILSPDGIGIGKIEELHVPFEREIKIALVSDGLFRLVDTYMAYDLCNFFSNCHSEAGIKSLIDEARALEASDVNCSRYPRVKSADDATAIVVLVKK